MKKIILLIMALIVVPVFPNSIFVFSNVDFDLYYLIGARPTDGTYYPYLSSRGPYTQPGSSTPYFVLLEGFENTTYAHASGFPFDSPVTLPASAQISHWTRTLTPGSPAINTTNSLAQMMFGSTHRYSEFKFFMLDENDNHVLSGNIDPIDLDVPSEMSGFGITITYFPLDGDVFILFDYTP